MSAVNGTARSAARVATPRVKPQPEAARPVPTAPLTAVVHDAVRRWFQEAHKEAQRGDVVSHSLLILRITCLALLQRFSYASAGSMTQAHCFHVPGSLGAACMRALMPSQTLGACVRNSPGWLELAVQHCPIPKALQI